MTDHDSRTYGIVDVETTGVRPNDVIVEFACFVVDNSGRRLFSYDTVIDPGRPPGPTWLHGITQAMCGDAPLFGDVARTIHELIVGRVIVAHNLRFDWAMLRRAFDQVEATFLREAQGICTAELARNKGMTGGLQHVARQLGLEVLQPHRALDDARTTRDLWLKLGGGRLGQGQPLPPASGAHRLRPSRPASSRVAWPSDADSPHQEPTP